MTSSANTSASGDSPAHRERQRRKTPKTRTGCTTCKRRHVRCDETKPYCLKCTSFGRVCEGYATPKAWIFEPSSTKDQKPPRLDSDSTFLKDPVITSPISQWRGPEYEERALDFFRLRTAVVLAAFTTTANYFWRNIVPQLCQTSTIIRHCAIAASSLQEAIDYRPQLQESTRRRQMFLKHYTKAITTLTDTSQPPSAEVVLTSCLLFLACENFQGSTLAGLTHVHSGLQILREYRTNHVSSITVAGSPQEIISKYIGPIFARLEAQSYIYEAHDPKAAGFCDMNLYWAIPVTPREYSDLFQARDSLHEIMQWSFLQMRRYREKWNSNHSEFYMIKALLKQWELSLVEYVAKLDDSKSVESRTARTLVEIHQKMFVILTEAFVSTEMIWDTFTKEIQDILTTGADIISYQERVPTSDWTQYSKRLSLFEYDFGAIPSLFSIACHCRHPTLRRQALRLMRYLHRSEGAWDTCSAAKIAEGVIQIEERGIDPQTAADIPETSRIRALSADKSPDDSGKVILSYQKYPYTTVSYEEIEWASWSRPELDSVTIWPITDLIRLGGYQGLIRPAGGTCICKAYGAPQSDRIMRVPGTNLVLKDQPRPLGLLSV